MSDMQFRAVRKRSNKSESEKATDSESVEFQPGWTLNYC
jgi:hypothetical protein